MTISKWRHPIKYLRLVTTPTCDKCRNCRGASTITTYNYRCASRRYLEHVNRLRGTNHGIALARDVRGTRWCRFEPKLTGKELLDDLFGEIEEGLGGTDD